jgi:REP element-mobilizing transposase RayT
MARKPREEEAGAIFHVYARGNKKADISVDDADRHEYVALLAATVLRQRWACLAYCLMPNHVHLVMRTPEPNLAVGMQRLHSRYAQTFNERHGFSGHVFQGRYGAVRITDDAQLGTTVGYVATNPVAAGLVEDPEQWRWGSHRMVATGAVPSWLAVEDLCELLAGAHGGDGRARYDDLVSARLEAGVTVRTSEVVTSAGAGSVVR